MPDARELGAQIRFWVHADLIEGSGDALYPLGNLAQSPSCLAGRRQRTWAPRFLLSRMQFFPLLMFIRTPAGYEVLVVETLQLRPASGAPKPGTPPKFQLTP
jgi:hypothetical protein